MTMMSSFSLPPQNGGLKLQVENNELPKEIPAWLALACAHKATVWVDGKAEPIGIMQALKSPEWPLWKEAIEKEIMGLLMMDLWDEVPRSSVPAGTKVHPGHFVFKIKHQNGIFVKCKARYVFGGHRSIAGVDFLDTMAYMASMRSVRTVLALAAPANHYLRNFDISQAFTFAEATRKIYMDLPPLEKLGITNPLCGNGKRSGNVALLKRQLYGQRDSGRRWMQLLDNFMVNTAGAVPLISDKQVYIWNFRGKVARFAIHVDDILMSSEDLEMQVEFSRLLRKEFGQNRVTENETDWILGMKIFHDRKKKTITLSQEAFVWKFLSSLEIDFDTKAPKTPLPSDPHFVKFEGKSNVEDCYRMMMICGSLQWLQTCTRPDLSFATNMLSRYASNPSPEHLVYANHVLRYLKGTAHFGITYHGDQNVLKCKGYDTTNKVIGTVDSDLGGCHDSERSTTGLVLMLNGGPIVWRSSRQSTASTATAEAEVKAAGMIGQQLIDVVNLLGEFGFVQPPVRVLEDNAATVLLSRGTKQSGKSGHFRRMVSYIEGLTNKSIFWLDPTPSKENPSDLLTKSVTPSELFIKLRDIIRGETPFMYVSDFVKDTIEQERIIVERSSSGSVILSTFAGG